MRSARLVGICWLSRDPIGEAGGINLYAYVGNDPVNAIDPLGLWKFEIYGGAGIAGFLSFGYNDHHFSWRVGVGAGDGLGGSYDGRDIKPDGVLAPGAFEGGLLGRLDLGLPLAGVGVAGELSGAQDQCGKSQATAKLGGSAAFLTHQAAGEFGGQTDPSTRKWHSVTDSSTQIPVPSLEALHGNFSPKEGGVGGFFGVFFGRQ